MLEMLDADVARAAPMVEKAARGGSAPAATPPGTSATARAPEGVNTAPEPATPSPAPAADGASGVASGPLRARVLLGTQSAVAKKMYESLGFTTDDSRQLLSATTGLTFESWNLLRS